MAKTWRGLLAVIGFLLSLPAWSEVSLPNGTAREYTVDLEVKVLGGTVMVDRQFVDGRWWINRRWMPAELGGLPVEQGGCRAYPEIKVQDRTYSGDGQTWLAENRFSVRATGYFDGSDCAANRIQTLRWQDRNTGNWMEYRRADAASLQFLLVRYGDRNDVQVSLDYDAQGHLQAVRDHFGNIVLSYVYGNGHLTEIRDNPADGSVPRSVKYLYGETSDSVSAGQPIIDIGAVIDVLGNPTQYKIIRGEQGKGQLAGVDHPGSLTTPATFTYQGVLDFATGTPIRSYEYLAGRVIKSTDADGETRYVYDYDRVKKQFYARVTEPATAAGSRITENWYDTDGLLIRRDVNGHTLEQKSPLDPATRSQSLTDAAGNATEVVKDEFGHIVQTTNPDGSISRASYSALHGQVVEEIDELGVKTQYEYDAKGNLLKKTEAAGLPEQRVTEYAVDQYGQVIRETRKAKSITLPNGQTVAQPDIAVEYAYDDRGNRTDVTDALGYLTQYAYDIQGNVIRITEANDQVWQASYDAKGQLLSRTDPLGHTRRWDYDRAGNRIRQTDAMGHVTAIGYDALNRPTSRKDALGNTTTYQYDALGQLTAVLDPLGKAQQRLNYDSQGRLVQNEDGAGNAIRYTYDYSAASDAPVTIAYPGFQRSFSYDKRGRAVETRDMATPTSDGLSQTVTYTRRTAYDQKGQPIEETDRLGNKTQMAYDALGRLAQSTDARGGVTRYSYDGADNLLAVTDANGNTTRYGYEANGRRTSETRPLGETTQYRYDAVGNLAQVIDPKGNQLAYRYDAARRRIEETHTPAGAAAPRRTIAYSYNDADALTGYGDSNSGHPDHLSHSAAYTLDALQRRIQESLTLGGQTVTLATSYHPTGRKASQTWPDGSTLNYSYDDAQQLQEIQFPSTGSLPTGSSYSIGERQWNVPTAMLYPGGSTRSHSLDGFGRLIELRVKSPGQVELMRYRYQYDAESNITRKDTEHGAYAYQYDSLYRLTAADNPEMLPDEAYGYDPLGNRITDSRKPNPAQADNRWQYNTGNQLLQAATENTAPLGSNSNPIDYRYDENGSLVHKHTSLGTETAHPYENQQFAYDAQNRLAEVQDLDGNLIASYQYDPYGRRIRKTLHRQWNGSEWSPLAEAETHSYVYSQEGLIAEYQAQGANATQLAVEYGWQPEGIWGTNPIWIKTNAANESQAEYFYYQNDHLGTPQQIIDSQGNAVWRQKSTAFGETIVAPSAVIVNNFRFPGQYYDNEKRTHYNYFRYYETTTGQYLQSDPLGLLGGPNLYGYARQSSVNIYDPLGLEAGKPYDTLEEAVCNAAADTQAKPQDREYGGLFYKLSDNKVAYTEPQWNPRQDDPSTPNVNEANPFHSYVMDRRQVPEQYRHQIVGDYHSHWDDPTFPYRSKNTPSPDDTKSAAMSDEAYRAIGRSWDSFLITPNEGAMKIDPYKQRSGTKINCGCHSKNH